MEIYNTIRRWMIKLGLLKELPTVMKHRNIDIDDEHFRRVDYWNRLYKGFPDTEGHEMQYQTVDGQKKRRMLTMNLGKQVTNEMATLIFNEKVEINIDDENMNDIFDAVMADNDFNQNMQNHIEYGLALGGFVVKPYFKNDKIKFSYVTANNFIPLSWDSQGVTEAVFPNRVKKGRYWYTHLEWHEWVQTESGEMVYRIKNTLYETDSKDSVGYPVPLAKLYPTLEEEITFTGLQKKAMFVYIKPNTANNFDIDSPLGISIYANATDTMETIDRMFDSFNREFKLGKKRIIVPDHMVKTVIDGDGYPQRYFDADDETYQAFKSGNDEDTVKDISTVLRVEEHISAMNTMLSLLASQTGFSPNAFSFDGQSMKTATEVISENSKTFKTKQSHEILLAEALKDLVDLTAYLTGVFGLGTFGEYQTVIHFDDSIAEDKTAENERIMAQVQAKMMPKYRGIMKIFGLSDEEAKQWVEEIQAENQTVTGLDVDLFGNE